MKNKITDLNNHLFAQLERLSEEDISDEQLAKEINRSKAINSIAGSIVDAATVSLEAMKLMEKQGFEIKPSENFLLGAAANNQPKT